MRFPNAAVGVKRLFTAEILSILSVFALIGSAVGAVLLFATDMAQKSGEVTADSVASAGSVFAIVTVVCIIIFAVVGIISFVMHIMGLARAGKDRNMFRIALAAMLLKILVTVTEAAFTGMNNGVVSSLMEVLTTILDMISLIYVIQGIRSIAVDLGNDSVDRLGDNIFKVILVAIVLEFTANVIVLIFGGQTVSLISAIISLIAAILTIVQYLMYLVYLGKAKKMLASSL